VVCSTLGRSLDSASQRLSTADTIGTRTHVRRFLGELSNQRQAGAVTDNAYWLLKPNAEFVLKRHLLPQGRLMPRDEDPDA
jgi:hypothetical protein